MLLTIRTLSCPPPDNPQSIHAQFGSAGGRIGRSPPCTLILPDPNRHISREHAEIRFRDNAFSIKVVSKVNSVMVNDTLIGPGEAAQLSNGDQILIGEYLMRADITAAAAVVASPAMASPFAKPVAASPFDVFDSLAPAAAPAPAALAPDWFQAPPPIAAPAVSATTNLDDFFKPQVEASKLGEVLSKGAPSTSVPEPLFTPAPPAAPADTRLDQFLGLHDPLSTDSAMPAGGSHDLYRASPLNVPLRAAVSPVIPAAPAPASYPSHDDIFKALEQDFGSFGLPPAPPAPVAAPTVAPIAAPFPPAQPADLPRTAPLRPPERAWADEPTPPLSPPSALIAGELTPVAISIPDPVLAAAHPLTPGLPRSMPGPAAALPTGHGVLPADPPQVPVATAPVGLVRGEPTLFHDPTPSFGRGAPPDLGQAASAVASHSAVSLAEPQPAAAPASGADVQRLMLILCESLGLEPRDMDLSDPERTIRLVGELLRMSTDGLFRLLEMRSQVKSELHIEDRTMIASRENNPLKHADTPRDAITYLVDLRQHGNKLFMPPVKAVEDTIWDICAHEMAVMAGTREALLAALKMFSPEAIEGRIKKTGALENVLPALHKSRLWERFLGMHAELQQAAKEDFDRLLNQEFAKAYSEQSKKLKKKR